MLLDRFRVQPAENRKFTIDYSERLQSGNLLAAIDSVVIDNATDIPFVVSAGLDAGKTKLVLFTSGGESLNDYKVDITVSTDDSQIWQDEIIYMCEDI